MAEEGEQQNTQYEARQLLERLQTVQARIDAALARREGDDDLELVAVSKTHPRVAIETLYEAGLRSFGESYVQEWEAKKEALPDDIRWHFVGRLQSNKARFVADEVAMVHSVDRKSVAKQLHRRASAPVDVLLQVNLGNQDTKGGVVTDELAPLFERLARYDNLRIRGLMGMPPYADDPEASRPYFRRLRQALVQLQEMVAQDYPERRPMLTELSMGMSNDFEVAIEEGATIVRLGTIIFGKRDYHDD